MKRAIALCLAAASLFAGALSVGAAARGDGSKVDVSNMDLDLLRENLLKVWILEYQSSNYNQSRIAEKSFEGLNRVPPTGDPEIDRQNEEGRRKTDKHLRHYITLELDGCIEAVDIVDRVLGQKVAIDGAEAERRRFFVKELPPFNWKNVLLQDAVRDLGRMTGTPCELHPVIPKNVTLEVSLESPAGFTVLSVLEYLNGLHPIEWEYKDGRLDVTYLGDLPKSPMGR